MKQMIYYFYAYYSIFLTILLIFFDNKNKSNSFFVSIWHLCIFRSGPYNKKKSC